jgi:hypothetical protein
VPNFNVPPCLVDKNKSVKVGGGGGDYYNNGGMEWNWS